MNQEQADRLCTLRDAFEHMHPRGHYQVMWIRPGVGPDRLEYKSPSPIRKNLRKAMQGEHPCGTSACVWGMAPVLWPKLFRWEFGYLWFPIVLDKKNTHYPPAQSCSELFGISEDEACYLIDPIDGPQTPPEVVKRVDKLLDAHGWESG